MTDNPYSSPNATAKDSNERSLVCVCMFWLTAILGVVVLGIMALGGYGHIVFASQNSGRIPPYIIAVTFLMAVCALALFYSASRWKSRSVLAGLLSFFGAGILYFGVPRLLLMLLMR